jgi:hypothetical protein
VSGEHRYWFRPKSYGYGAAPVTWEGWAVTIAVCAGLVGSIFAMQALVDGSDFFAWITWFALAAVAILWFVRFCRRHTDGEWRWRWGKDGDRMSAE